MGRLPKNRSHQSLYSNPNILKTKHRHADTKYRANMQYLYSKLREMSKNEASKDSVLNVTLHHIQALENEIIEKVGCDEMKNYQDDFKNFLLWEEALWKIKDTVKWWRKVEEALDLHEFTVNESATSDRSTHSNLQQKDATSIKYNQRSSCSDEKMTVCPPSLQTSNGVSTRSAKSKKNSVDCAFDVSGNSNVFQCFPKFQENAFPPCYEEPDSVLNFEERNYFTDEISADPGQFETNLF